MAHKHQLVFDPNHETSDSLQVSLFRFADNLRALRGFVDFIEPVLHEQHEKTIQQNLKGYLPIQIAMGKIHGESANEIEKYEQLQSKLSPSVSITLDEDTAQKRSFKIEGDGGDIKDILVALNQTKDKVYQVGLLYQGTLMNLISIVELFLSRAMRYYYKMYPNSLSSKDKVFSLDELAAFDTVEDARAHLIDKRIEDVMRGSFDDWIIFFREKVGLSMGYLKDHMDLLVEACIRRNLFVHNGGIVNSIYLSKVSKEFLEKHSKGETIVIDRDYLDLRIDLFERCCLLIVSELWKKLAPHDEVRIMCLTKIAYDHLCDGRYEIAESLSRFSIDDKGQSEAGRIVAQMNYWLSLKKNGQFDTIKKEIESFEVTAKEIKFQLAHAALLDKNDLFFRLLPLALASGSVSKEDLGSFPIFEEMRRDSRYRPHSLELEIEAPPPPPPSAATAPPPPPPSAATAPPPSAATAPPPSKKKGGTRTPMINSARPAAKERPRRKKG